MNQLDDQQFKCLHVFEKELRERSFVNEKFLFFFVHTFRITLKFSILLAINLFGERL